MTTDGTSHGPHPTPAPATTTPHDLQDLVTALTLLRDTVAAARYPVPLPQAAGHRDRAWRMRDQLDDYLIPRLTRMEAPLLAVLGGATGAGKSTLINSLVRTPVSPAGALRPTTRAPVLVCHPDDAPWFQPPWLESLRDRVSIVEAPQLTPGIALLDAPDIDSVADDNRRQADRLLAAADLWLFVTTAARYADAVPWDILRTARDRSAATAIVLNRVPPAGAHHIPQHLTAMLADHDLMDCPLFVIGETTLTGQGLLSETQIAPLGDWMSQVAGSPATRRAIVRQTLGGAIDVLRPQTEDLASGADEQVDAGHRIHEGIRDSFSSAGSSAEWGLRDGALLRGELLARWEELAASGFATRLLPGPLRWATEQLGWVSDWVADRRGHPVPRNRVHDLLRAGISALVRHAVTDAAERATALLLAQAGSDLIAAHPDLSGPDDHLDTRAEAVATGWQAEVLDLVRAESRKLIAAQPVGAAARVRAWRDEHRRSPYAVDASALLVMIRSVAAPTTSDPNAGRSEADRATLVAQDVLNQLFDPTVGQRLVLDSRDSLITRVTAEITAEADRYERVIRGIGVNPDLPGQLRGAARAVTVARLYANLPAARTTTTSLPHPDGKDGIPS